MQKNLQSKQHAFEPTSILRGSCFPPRLNWTSVGFNWPNLACCILIPERLYTQHNRSSQILAGHGKCGLCCRGLHRVKPVCSKHQNGDSTHENQKLLHETSLLFSLLTYLLEFYKEFSLVVASTLALAFKPSLLRRQFGSRFGCKPVL